MAQITITTQVVDDDVYGGKHPVFPAMTYTQTYTEKYQQTFSLADTVAVVGWDPSSASAAVTAFSTLIVRTDATAGVDMEFVSDSTGTAGAFQSVRIMKDVPFMLGADDSYQDESTSAALGNTLDVIDKIRFVNPTTSTTVNVTLLLLS